MIITALNELKDVREKTEGKIVVASGSFDLFHYDHLRYLEDAKKYGDILVVFIKSNKAVKLKGANRPVISEEQRIAIVDAIKYVDYTMIVDYDENKIIDIEYDNALQEEWLKLFEGPVAVLAPDVWCHEDSATLKNARLRLFEKYKIQGVARTRGDKTSTTQIVNRLTKEH